MGGKVVSAIEAMRHEHVAIQKRISGLPILPGDTAFRMHDTHGIPLDLIRAEARRKGAIIDEWGLRLSMYLAGWNVPEPVPYQIPRLAEVDSPADNSEVANRAWDRLEGERQMAKAGG